jgi:DNA segregation ATPase FtsK/SpoIIIE, S-DNA-T family
MVWNLAFLDLSTGVFYAPNFGAVSLPTPLCRERGIINQQFWMYMGRKKKDDKKSNEKLASFSNLQEETLQAVLGIIFFVIGTFLLLSAFGVGGPAGNWIFKTFKNLFGYGYYILALLFFMLCASSFQSLKRSFSASQIIGSILFFLSSLGLVTISITDGGGMLGTIVARPLIALFEIYATTIILVGLMVISFLITFDTALRLDFLTSLKNFILRRKEIPEGDVAEEVVTIKQPRESTATEESEEPRPLVTKMFDRKKPEPEEAEITLKRREISLAAFTPPPLSLLEKDRGKPGVGDIKANANIIKRTLQNFGIVVEMDEVSIGPSITRYALKPAEGVKLSKILGLQTNLELALAAHPVRIEAPIPGKSLVGIEIPNTSKTTVGLGTLLSESEFQNSDKPLLVSLGKGISGKSHFANIAKMPHCLIAGATGSGKSVTIHAIIASLLFRNGPESLKLIMIDPKRVELTLYNNIPHLLTPVITEAKKSILALKWAAKEMDRRYDVLEQHSVRDIESYHKNILEPKLKNARSKGKSAEESDELPETMPYIVIIIDELADIMQSYPRELESAIVRLAQMSRAVGIHLILSTQRPSVNVITGLIKANVPSRIALQVASQIDSRTILDAAGAEKLLGAGDMLYMSGEMSKPQRIQSAYITESEVKKLAKYLAENYEHEAPSEINLSSESGNKSIFESSLEAEDDDDLYEEAREEVMRAGKASTSYLQRKLGVGYARAARLMDMLEERGVVGPGAGSKPREVLMNGDGMGVNDEENG